MGDVAHGNMGSPDRVREFPNGSTAFSTIGGITLAKWRFEPGWRWSNDVQPIVGTEWCMIHHRGYALSGTLHVITEEGAEVEISAGEGFDIEPAHDAWVVGDEAFVSIDFSQEAQRYAQPPT